jgi:intracellular multiplication protein IcmK
MNLNHFENIRLKTAPLNGRSGASKILFFSVSSVILSSFVFSYASAQTLPGAPPALPSAPSLPEPPSSLPESAPEEISPSLPDAAASLPADSLGAPSFGSQFEFEKNDEQLEKEKREQAFGAALEGVMPLKPGEIRQLLEKFDRTQESVELPVYPPPKPKVSVQTVSLDPGAAPLTVKVAFGNVSTLSFLDITGAPWPIEDLSWAGPFEVIGSDSNNGAHILRITPQSEFASGNISLRLLTLKTPVILSIETSRETVDYRFDAVVPEYGPMAKTPIVEKGLTISAGDPDISSVLMGSIPPGAKKLDVIGVDGRTSAYKLGGSTYVRTPLTLLSPGWSSSVTSADGTRVYAIKDTPVLLLSDKGKMVRARLAPRNDLVENIKND